jgi:hypothetical protein
MSSTNSTHSSNRQRLDTLLALSYFFSQSDSSEEAKAQSGHSPGKAAGLLDMLAQFDANDRRALEERAELFQALDQEEQMRWLATTLARGRVSGQVESERLDEYVHPSHLIAALDKEPKRIQHLILSHLPERLAEFIAAEMGLARTDSQAPLLSEASERQLPDSRILGVIRRAFLSNFVSGDMLLEQTPLDRLLSADLARLVRLLGARETAIACRGIETVETVAAFLRHFSAEDSRAIATCMAALTEIEPRRLRFAEQVVHASMDAGLERAELLDQIGLRLLALTIERRELAAKRYIKQKLPGALVTALEAMCRGGWLLDGHEIVERVIGEVEALAVTISLQLHTPPIPGEADEPRAKSEEEV